MLAFTMVALVGFLGLSIDLGMLAIAKTQTQQAADLAALTAARTLNGNASTTYNSSGGHHQRPKHLYLQHDFGQNYHLVATDAHVWHL